MGIIKWGEQNPINKLITSLTLLGLVFIIIDLFFSTKILISVFSFSPLLNKSLIFPWTYVSYMFVHTDLWVLFIHGIIFYLYGNIFYQRYGFRCLFALFISSGVIGAISYQVFYLILSPDLIKPLALQGASAGIIGLFTAQVFREHKVLKINSKVHIPYETFILLLLICGIIELLFAPSNIGGSIAHISASLWGILYGLLFRKKQVDLSEYIAKIIDNIVLLYQKLRDLISKQFSLLSSSPTRTKRKKGQIEKKMRESGYTSLEEDEKHQLLK